MRRDAVLGVRWAFLIALVCLPLCFVSGAAKYSGRDVFSLLGMPRNEEEAKAQVAATRIDNREADESMLIREQVDFLLTPALLVQEAISEDVVLTYPGE